MIKKFMCFLLKILYTLSIKKNLLLNSVYKWQLRLKDF